MVVAAFEKVIVDCEEELGLLGKKVEIPKTPFPELRFPKIYDILSKFGKTIPFPKDVLALNVPGFLDRFLNL
jgi:aspartyl-tRNA synthetase